MPRMKIDARNAADIADHSAAQSQQNRVPVRATAHQFGSQLFQLRKRLGAFAVGHPG